MNKLTWRQRRRLRRRLRDSRSLLESNRDLISPQQAAECEAALERLQQAQASRVSEQVEEAMERLNKLEKNLFPRPAYAGWQELVDVLLVAALVAFGGIRTFFVQPFKIPSASMAPTLLGVEPRVVEDPMPGWPQRIVEMAFLGRHHIEVIARADGDWERNPRCGALACNVSAREWLFLPRQWVEVRYGGLDYTLPVGMSELYKIRDALPRRVKAGERILRATVTAGDHLLVDRFSYNFRAPRRGEIVVFDTEGIPVPNPGWFYIKRLNGIGGDHLRLDEPHLYVNGRLAHSSPVYQKIYEHRDGYHGFAFAPEGQEGTFLHVLTINNPSYTVPLGHYFMMGDNSRNSSDSRYWGPIPHGKIVGKAWVVYWPWSDRFGNPE